MNSNGSLAIRALISGYPDEVRKRKLIVMLQGFIDDSGSDEKGALSRYFVLAGYVMLAPIWEQFSDKWDNELGRQPAIKAFKMSDAEAGEGYFTGMPQEFRRLKVNELAEIIAEFSEFYLALHCHLDWKDYAEIVRGNVHPKMDSPYAVLFYQIMRGAHEHQIWMNKQYHVGFHKVDFIFDEQGAAGLRAVQWYSLLVSRLPEPYNLMAGDIPSFKDDETVLPLQAADMLAWHIRRKLERPDEQRPILDRISEGWGGEMKIGRDTLTNFVKLAQMANPDELASAL